MAYEMWPCPDGEFAVDWDIVYRLIRSHECARIQIEHFDTVNVSQSDWYNPFTWSMPDIMSVEIDWAKVRSQVETQTETKYNLMVDSSLRFGMGDQANELLQKVRQTRRLKESFLDKMREVQQINNANLEEAIRSYDGHIEKAKFVRNTSAGTLMVGATFLSGGTAAAVIAGGSTLKGVGKFQDTGSVGAAAMEATGTLVFSLIPVKGPKGETLLAVVEAGWETGIGLVEGKTFAEALGTGSLKLVGPGVDKVFGSSEVTKMLGRVAIPVKPNVSMALTKLGVEFTSKAAASVAKGQIDKHGGNLYTGAFGKKPQTPPRSQNSVVDRMIIDDEMLLKAAIVNMEKGIARGW